MPDEKHHHEDKSSPNSSQEKFTLIDVNQSIESQHTSENNQELTPFQQQLFVKIQEMMSELEEIKSSRAWRLVKYLWGLPIYSRIRRRLKSFRKNNKPRHIHHVNALVFRALGSHNKNSKGDEVWLLAVSGADRVNMPWHSVDIRRGFQRRKADRSPLGEVLYCAGQGEVRIPIDRKSSAMKMLAHPWSGFAEIVSTSGTIRLDLYSEVAGDVEVDLQTGQVNGPRGFGHVISHEIKDGTLSAHTRRDVLTPEDVAWIEHAASAKPKAIVVLHPDWLGIRSSSLQLFSTPLFIGDDVSQKVADRYAKMICATDCKRVVFSGFAYSHRNIIFALRKVAPRIKIFVLWHGNFLQSREQYNWKAYREIVHLYQRGQIYKVGFVKKGMAEAHTRLLGMRTSFVMNYLEKIPDGPSEALPGGPHLGVWSIWTDNWRKPPFAMLIAASLIQGAVVHGSHAGPRTNEFMKLFNIEGEFAGKHLPQQEMPEALAKMHLNLYVTLSECAPMLPFESLSVGVPCLFGPNSHLFDDDEYLQTRLVVPHPDSSEVIANYISQALIERNEIVSAYREYMPAYIQRAKKSVIEFLEIDGV
jgi:hypothetical protein